jgi:hypothetical protein
MSRKMFLVLSMLVLLSMGLMGVTYSAWSQALLITGTVATGTIDVEVIDGEVGLNGDNDSVGTCAPENTTAYNLTVAVGNVYDGFTCHIPLEVENTGSVPVSVTVPMLTWTDPVGSAPTGVTVVLDDCWTGTVQLDHDVSTADDEDYEDCKVSVEVGEGVLPGDSFAFHFDFSADQFNK